MKLSKTSALLLGLLVIAGAVGYRFTMVKNAEVVAAAKDSEDKPGSLIGVVKKQDLKQRVSITGQIWPKKRLDIRPPFDGYLIKIFVHVGDHLKAGSPLATFGPSLSGGETNFPIRTGFDGVVTQVLKSEGEYVTVAQIGGFDNLVLRFEDTSELTVLATVPELDIAKIKLGQEALVKVSALTGESFKAKIREISLSAKDKDKYASSSTEFQIKATLLSHDPRLMTGMSSLMDVITSEKDGVLVLPHEYVQEKESGGTVTMEDGRVQEIKIGLATDEAVEIVSGLKEGDRVRAVDYLHMPKPED